MPAPLRRWDRLCVCAGGLGAYIDVEDSDVGHRTRTRCALLQPGCLAHIVERLQNIGWLAWPQNCINQIRRLCQTSSRSEGEPHHSHVCAPCSDQLLPCVMS